MEFDFTVSVKEEEKTVKRMKARLQVREQHDSSPGPDKVLVRTLKFLPCKSVLAKLKRGKGYCNLEVVRVVGPADDFKFL
jgi:hypothetical protein